MLDAIPVLGIYLGIMYPETWYFVSIDSRLIKDFFVNECNFFQSKRLYALVLLNFLKKNMVFMVRYGEKKEKKSGKNIQNCNKKGFLSFICHCRRLKN